MTDSLERSLLLAKHVMDCLKSTMALAKSYREYVYRVNTSIVSTRVESVAEMGQRLDFIRETEMNSKLVARCMLEHLSRAEAEVATNDSTVENTHED